MKINFYFKATIKAFANLLQKYLNIFICAWLGYCFGTFLYPSIYTYILCLYVCVISLYRNVFMSGILYKCMVYSRRIVLAHVKCILSPKNVAKQYYTVC